MNTETRNRRPRSATGIILGCALAITPITAYAAPSDASATTNLRQQIEADRGQTVREVQPNLRQQIEADRGQTVREVQPNLRQQIEADRGQTVGEVQPNLRQQMEADRGEIPVPPSSGLPNDTDPRQHRDVRAAVGPPAAQVRLLAVGLR